ncbi:MAG: hypothetical protein HOV87_18235, partial [Catenulispora sp.]|nr:hypothetical protein [Catenulispora sp.]
MSDTFECLVSLSHRDFVMRNHRVHGVSVLPGAAFFDIVYRILRARGEQTEQIALNDVLFAEPVATAEGLDRELRIVVEPGPDGARKVSVHSRAVRDGRPAGEWRRNFTAELRHTAEPVPEPIDPAALKAAATRVRDMAEMYRQAREEDIEHGTPMKCFGELYQGADFLLAELDLAEEVRPQEQGFQLHPGKVDAATLTAFAQVPPGEPFIPMYVESFRAVRPLRGRFYVHVPAVETFSPSGEIQQNDCVVYDASGAFVARFGKFTCKRLRSAGLITRLVATAEPVATATAEPVALAVAEPVVAVSARSAEVLTVRVREMVAEVLGVPAGEVDAHAGFYDLGLDSVAMLRISGQLEELLGRRLYPTLLFEYNDVASLVEHLAAESVEGPVDDTPDRGLRCYRRVWQVVEPALSAGGNAGDLVVIGGEPELAAAFERAAARDGARSRHLPAGSWPLDRERLRLALADAVHERRTPTRFVLCDAAGAGA